jgi:hypothetical protein
MPDNSWGPVYLSDVRIDTGNGTTLTVSQGAMIQHYGSRATQAVVRQETPTPPVFINNPVMMSTWKGTSLEYSLSESPGRCHPKVEFLDISMKWAVPTKKILKFVVKNAEARCRKAV